MGIAEVPANEVDKHYAFPDINGQTCLVCGKLWQEWVEHENLPEQVCWGEGGPNKS